MATTRAMGAIRETRGAWLLGMCLVAGGCAGNIEGEEMPGPGAPDVPGARPPRGSAATGGTGGLIDDPAKPPPPGTMPAATSCAGAALAPMPRLVRLTRLQYENSVRDLTGLDVRPARDLPQDASFLGFDRAVGLEVGDIFGRVLGEQAASIARQVVATPAGLARVVACDPMTGDACTASFIADFGRKTFRRPLTDAEKARYAALFKQANTNLQQDDPFSRGVQAVVEAMLQSPLFVYRFESATKRDGAQIALGSHEIAARLSYMLTNTTPDAALSQAADRNELADPAAVVAQARRLLETPHGKAMIRDFYGQWMQADDWGNHAEKSAMRYPAWKPSILPALVKELDLFADAVAFERKKGLATLLTAPFTYVNKATAPIYGVPGTFADAHQKVDLDASQRSGLVTQLGFLAANASSLTSSPIHRGVFVQRALLCTAIPPPGEQVPPLPPTSAGKTTREVVTEHTNAEGCRGCHHTLINPVGFGLENFDAIGAWRSTENGKPIDSSGSLVGTAKNLPFKTPVEMARAIAESSESKVCYAKQWLRYSFGREEKEGDACALEALARAIGNDSYTPSELMVDMVRSRAFVYRSAEGL